MAPSGEKTETTTPQAPSTPVSSYRAPIPIPKQTRLTAQKPPLGRCAGSLIYVFVRDVAEVYVEIGLVLCATVVFESWYKFISMPIAAYYVD